MKNLLVALGKAQAAFPPLKFDSTNPAFRNKYASLASVLSTVMPVLHQHGLVLVQAPSSGVIHEDDGTHYIIVNLTTTIYHAESGEQISSTLSIVPAKQDAQGIGSAITYARRYLILAMCGIAADDDDGDAASGPMRSQPKPASKPASKTVAQAKRLPDAEVWMTWNGPDDALGWALEAFDSVGLNDSANGVALGAAYDDLKAKAKPKSAREMFELWFRAIEDAIEEALHGKS